ncbi:hypothetical protein GCM10028825_02530 [Spirosoma agri]
MEPVDFGQTQSVKVSAEVAEQYRIEFAKLMAKAVAREDVRTLLKTEAKKQFDNDTDILYQRTKNTKLENGQTFEEALIELYGSQENFNKIVNSLPLLTIFIPTLDKFSVDKWDIKTELPQVASYPNKIGDGKNQYTFPAFTQAGESVLLQKHIKPTSATILIKDNERLFVKNKDNQNARLPFGANRLINEGGVTYDFIDASFDASFSKSVANNKQARIARSANELGQEVKDSYEFGLQYQRDYIYYGIAPERGVNTGTLRDNYYEYITTFGVLSPASFDHIVDDPTNDWGDGNLEFVINVIAVDGKSALNTQTKGFSCNLRDMFFFSGNKDSHQVYNSYTYFLPTPIELFRWDMERYGDAIKFLVYESDPTTSGTTTYSTTTTSTYGFNFNIGVKDGPNFGINASNVDARNHTYSVVVAGAPDYLYDAVLTWRDKVVTEKYDLGGGSVYYGINDVQTGTVSMTVEPRRKF